MKYIYPTNYIFFYIFRKKKFSSLFWRNKTHSFGSHIYFSSVGAKLIIRAGPPSLYRSGDGLHSTCFMYTGESSEVPEKNVCTLLYYWSFTTAFTKFHDNMYVIHSITSYNCSKCCGSTSDILYSNSMIPRSCKNTFMPIVPFLRPLIGDNILFSHLHLS